MPRTFKINCNTKTKIDHGGIRNRYARASHYLNEVLCANSNFTEKFEQKVDSTVLGRLYIALF